MDFRYTLLESGLDFVRASLDHLTAAQASGDNQSESGHGVDNIGVFEDDGSPRKMHSLLLDPSDGRTSEDWKTPKLSLTRSAAPSSETF